MSSLQTHIERERRDRDATPIYYQTLTDWLGVELPT